MSGSRVPLQLSFVCIRRIKEHMHTHMYIPVFVSLRLINMNYN